MLNAFSMNILDKFNVDRSKLTFTFSKDIFKHNSPSDSLSFQSLNKLCISQYV
jgi:hypothetical protein